MNPESSTLQAAVASISAGILALLGVDHLALIWGFIGALIGMMNNKPVARGGAIVSIFVTAMVGAAFGTLIADRFDAPGLSIRIVGSMLCAAGAQQLVPIAVRSMSRQLERIFGKDE